MTKNSYWITRLIFQRGLAFVYIIGFLIIFYQFRPLCGDNGLLPANLFMDRVSFWDAPSIFWWINGDQAYFFTSAVGVLLSALALVGITEAFATWFSVLSWLTLWILYSSFVNIGQTFFGFGWEIMLGEVGFLAIFMGAARSKPSALLVGLLRWVLFRLMFGAGLIKLRGDECWRDFTCMNFHYETQPLPGPLSWYFYQFPSWFHKLEVLFTYFVELIVPFGYFGPRMIRHCTGIITILFQLTLMASGNLSWLNYITLVVAFACFDDSALRWLSSWIPGAAPRASSTDRVPAPILYLLFGIIAVLSVQPTMNLFSPSQAMNRSFDPLHLVNTYGAFGSVTRTRYEIILEGTDDTKISSSTVWKEYEFKGKPGNPARRPPQVTPYHYKLDWQMWFAAMSDYSDHPWILNLISKLLSNHSGVLSLILVNPFVKKPPRFIRAELYEYHFTDPKVQNGSWWKRRRAESYLPPLSLSDLTFHAQENIQ